MKKAKSRLKGKYDKKSIGLFWVTTSLTLLCMAYGRFTHRNAQLVEPVQAEVVMIPTPTVTPTPSKPAEYSPKSKTHTLMKRHPELTAKIKALFGSEWLYAAELIARESSFNVQAINSSSGACGLGQALPCSKMKCAIADEDCQLAWVKKYVEGRYGSPKKAIAFHDWKGWY